MTRPGSQGPAWSVRRARARAERRGRRQRQGAVFVETLIAFLPLFFAFFGVLQLLELYAASLITRRAASAAVRAAVVVMPDNPRLYACGGGQVGQNDAHPCKMQDVVRAASLVLQAGHGFRGMPEPEVVLEGNLSGHSLVTAKVAARYRCFIPPLGFPCGLDYESTFRAEASLPYQEAGYTYDQ